MSQLNSTASQPGSQQKTHQKQRINVYTMMLIVAFIAICLACVCMYLELEKYGKYPWWKTDSANPASPATSSIQVPSDDQFVGRFGVRFAEPQRAETSRVTDPNSRII